MVGISVLLLGWVLLLDLCTVSWGSLFSAQRDAAVG